MPDYKLTLDHQQQLVRGTVQGEVSKPDGLKMIAEARTLAAENGYGILWDITKAQLLVKLADFFFLPQEVKELRDAPTSHVRVAILVQQDALDDFQFYEDVAANAGLKVKVFVDEHEAINWLT